MLPANLALFEMPGYIDANQIISEENNPFEYHIVCR
jgi:antibiotic biosynthesis monooxygenase (ABM) superfamily enzyme